MAIASAHAAVSTYDDHQKRCNNLEQEWHYWGLAIDQIILVGVSKIPWGCVGGRGCGGSAVGIRWWLR